LALIAKTKYTADVSTDSPQPLYEPLDMFGADAVEWWISKRDVTEIPTFANILKV